MSTYILEEYAGSVFRVETETLIQTCQITRCNDLEYQKSSPAWRPQILFINMFLTIQQNVKPDPTKFCGPYKPDKNTARKQGYTPKQRSVFTDKNHDTIGMVAIDNAGRIAAGTSTNGARFKIPGWVI